ncbi:MAG TPA: hypothetical protein VLC92_15345 [Rhodocyclaceae bacterium]|nr:hypothetical protein [Rhodocyclaceae bacterium]
MSILTALNAYLHLDTRQRTFMREKEIDTSMTLEEWIPFLGGVARADRASDVLRKMLGWLTILTIVPGFVLAIVTESATPLLLWIASSVSVFCWLRLRKIDMPPSLDRFLLPWLVLLKEDVAPKSEVSLRLDLRGAELTQKAIMAADMPNGVPRSPRACNDNYFRDDWASGTASLADGAILQWDISDFVRKRVKTRRNARGKTKRKTKYKIQRSFDVNLSVRDRDYAVSNIVPDTACRASVKRGEKRTAVRIRTRSVGRERFTPPRLTDLVDTISRAYSSLSVAPKER